MWRDLAARNGRDATLPEIKPERCVHALLAQASCRACVDACPGGAWRLDDEELGLDTAACDGCGSCIRACPQQAITGGWTLTPVDFGGRRVAFAACAVVHPGAVDRNSAGRVLPCLNALTHYDIEALSAQGVQTLITASGDCADCRLATALPWQDLVALANRMLASRAKPRVRLERLPLARWRSAARQALADPGPAMSRRGFFRQVLSVAAETDPDVTAFDGVAAGMQRRRADLASTAQREFVAWKPEIDPARCSGCDACVRLCPHTALSLERTGQQTHYRIEPTRCSGCGICRDVCDADAVSLSQWQDAQAETLALTGQRCRACGVAFHVPASQGRPHELCGVCATARHQQRLYQVFD